MKSNFTSGLLIGANLLLAVFLIMGVSSKTSETTQPTHEASVGMEPFIGEITMFAGNFAPRGWAFCNGQLLPIAQNQALFSILGTTYGGDGRTTFALPDLRGRVPVHAGQGPGLSTYPLGSSGGSETVTLTNAQMPNHNHDIIAFGKAGNTNDPIDAVMANIGSSPAIYSKRAGRIAKMKPTGKSGGGQPFEIRQPYRTIHYIIALQGVFPSRS